MNVFLVLAAAFSGFVFLVHTFVGGREIARPLLNAPDLQPMPKYVSYYCWHIATIALGALVIMFALAAALPQSWELGWTATALAAAFCVLGLALPPLKNQSYKSMPQGWLFLPILILGIAGGV